jgi:hypothetical protein
MKAARIASPEHDGDFHTLWDPARLPARIAIATIGEAGIEFDSGSLAVDEGTTWSLTDRVGDDIRFSAEPVRCRGRKREKRLQIANALVGTHRKWISREIVCSSTGRDAQPCGQPKAPRVGTDLLREMF